MNVGSVYHISEILIDFGRNIVFLSEILFLEHHFLIRVLTQTFNEVVVESVFLVLKIVKRP